MLARLVLATIVACAIASPNAALAQAIPRCEQSPYADILFLAPTFIQVQPKDMATGKTMILANGVFASFMAERKGTKEKNFQEFIDDFYVPFMEEREGKPIDFAIADFKRWAIAHGIDYLLVSKEERYTLADLGLEDRAALLDALASMDTQKVPVQAEQREYVGLWDPWFVALLLDQGISIGRGEIIMMPFLCDRRLP